jgi:hypothetical protein
MATNILFNISMEQILGKITDDGDGNESEKNWFSYDREVRILMNEIKWLGKVWSWFKTYLFFPM